MTSSLREERKTVSWRSVRGEAVRSEEAGPWRASMAGIREWTGVALPGVSGSLLPTPPHSGDSRSVSGPRS